MKGAPATETTGLARLAARGAAVAVGGQALKVGVQLATVVIMARLLTAHDYGLIAMVVTITGVADILRDFGLSSAAIQAQDLSRGQRDNLFWINTALGVVLAGVAVAGAPLVADVYGVPVLEPITRAMAILFVLNGMATQYRASLTRGLRFRSLVVADVAAGLTGLVAGVSAALLGAGFWSLVVQQVAQVATMLVLAGLASRWFPARPARDAPMDGLLRFGWHMVGAQLVNYAGNNADSLIVGTRFGPGSLGIYNRGYQLLMTPMAQLLAPATSVALPVLSRLQHDRERFAQYVGRAQLSLGYTLVAGLGLVGGAAPAIVALLLGGSWAGVVPVLRLFAAAAAFDGLAFVGYWVYLSRGLTAELRRFTVVTTALRIVCLLVGSQWGVIGVATGFAVAPALAWPLSLWWLSRKADLSVAPLLKGAFRVLLLTVVVAATSWVAVRAAGDLPAWLGLGAGVVAGTIGYTAVVLLLAPWRHDAHLVLDVVRKGLSRS